MLLCICKTHVCLWQLWEGTVLMTQDTEKSYSVQGDSAVLVPGIPLHYSCVESYLSNVIKQFKRHDLKVQVIKKPFTISYINVENPGYSTWVGVEMFHLYITPTITWQNWYIWFVCSKNLSKISHQSSVAFFWFCFFTVLFCLFVYF